MYKRNLIVFPLLGLASIINVSAATLYEEPNTHQVFTQDAPGRVELKDKYTPVQSKAFSLKFSGTHYLGFVSSKADGEERENRFETRRNYFQVKAYFNKKDFLRLTLDSFQETKGQYLSEVDLETGDVSYSSEKEKGSWLTRVKYAYLYLDNILPHTGVEFGQVHRPWIDYEEHHSWWYRSASKVYMEDGTAAHLMNSADLGFNLKTKLPYFSSEIGLFNGEGYHDIENGEGLSTEARFTFHALSTGTKKVKRNDDYLNISYYGVKSFDDNKRGNNDFTMHGIHAVYNKPAFLIAAQYLKADNGDYQKYDGDGYSLNFEIRPMKKLWFIGRYDVWDQNNARSNHGGDRMQYLLGAVYNYNKNVKFITNVKTVDFDEEDILNSGEKDSIDLMFTAEVKW
jgi:hypothetical protein